jgi:hypothetical protein
MPITIDTSLATETANSYADVAFADDYWENHYLPVKAAAWAALTDEAKATLLVNACRVLETARFTLKVGLPDFSLYYDSAHAIVLALNLDTEPVRYYFYQRLQFPRNIDVYKTGTQQGDLYVPDEVKWAQCEQAVYLLSLDETAMSNRVQGITMDKVGIGKGQIEATQEYAITGSSYSPIALEILRPYMIKGGRLRRA